jgi:hypothetical protein
MAGLSAIRRRYRRHHARVQWSALEASAVLALRRTDCLLRFADRYGTPPNWRSSGRSVYIRDMTSADKLLTPMYGPAVRVKRFGVAPWPDRPLVRLSHRIACFGDGMHRVAHDVAVALGGARLGDVNSPES